jgi:hypothetical protein
VLTGKLWEAVVTWEMIRRTGAARYRFMSMQGQSFVSAWTEESIVLRTGNAEMAATDLDDGVLLAVSWKIKRP